MKRSPAEGCGKNVEHGIGWISSEERHLLRITVPATSNAFLLLLAYISVIRVSPNWGRAFISRRLNLSFLVPGTIRSFEHISLEGQTA